MEMRDVFVSYAPRNRDVFETLHTLLRESGVSVYDPEETLSDWDSFASESPLRIRNAKVFVLLITEAVFISSFAKKEVEYARFRMPDPTKNMIPVHFPEAGKELPADLAMLLSGIPLIYVPGTSPEDLAYAVSRIVERVRAAESES